MIFITSLDFINLLTHRWSYARKVTGKMTMICMMATFSEDIMPFIVPLVLSYFVLPYSISVAWCSVVWQLRGLWFLLNCDLYGLAWSWWYFFVAEFGGISSLKFTDNISSPLKWNLDKSIGLHQSPWVLYMSKSFETDICRWIRCTIGHNCKSTVCEQVKRMIQYCTVFATLCYLCKDGISSINVSSLKESQLLFIPQEFIMTHVVYNFMNKINANYLPEIQQLHINSYTVDTSCHTIGKPAILWPSMITTA